MATPATRRQKTIFVEEQKAASTAWKAAPGHLHFFAQTASAKIMLYTQHFAACNFMA
jgi:predicted LPLAT superfamily acyltransferase